jgi:hypothetical protein
MKYIVLLSMLSLILGCTHQYKLYDYEVANIEIDSGRVEIKLTGSWNPVSKKPEITERRNPYSLVIRVFSNRVEAPIEIAVENITTGAGDIISINKKVGGVTRKPVSDLPPFTSFVYSGLILTEHEPITVKGLVLLEGKSVPINVKIIPKYSEEKKNNTYEGIMGI